MYFIFAWLILVCQCVCVSESALFSTRVLPAPTA